MTGSVTLSAPMPLSSGRDKAREMAVDRERQLERFLAGIERRAYRIAQLSLRDPDEAQDAVQDAMIRLARNYAGHPAEQWRPLFYRILRNRITDGQRRRRVRQGVIAWWPGTATDDGPADPVENAVDPAGTPEQQLEGGQLLQRIERALAELSGRQREVFMLRNFEGLDVAQTAIAMGCSEGSVKTHYFRAVHALQQALGE
ncbi:MAG TPA: RNA polymerase sigma factor [Steroidobacteraceae bacterium]|nr:RNA polymerase sigma factor [Steroidobacteraceae bacterium]